MVLLQMTYLASGERPAARLCVTCSLETMNNDKQRSIQGGD